MSLLAGQLLVASAGLALAAVVVAAWLAGWKRRPVRSYRLLVGLLVAACALPALQVGVRHLVPAHFFTLELSEPDRAASPTPRTATDLASGAARVEPPAPTPSATVGSASVALLEPRSEPSASSGTVDEPERLRPDFLVLLTTELARQRASAAELAAGAADWGARLPRVALWLYAVGVLFTLVRLSLRLGRTFAILRRARPVEDPALLALWRRVRDAAVERSGVPRRVRLAISEEVATPACFGLARPTIVVPASPAVRGGDALEFALQHELVHLERRDPWIVVLQELFGCVFWFHPAAWWLRRRLDALREISCDLLVVERTGSSKRYATALLDYADALCRPTTPRSAAMLPWTSPPRQLTRRIEMLVAHNRSNTGRRRRGPLVLVIGGLAALWTAQLTLAAHLPAQDPPAAPEAPAPSANPEKPDSVEAHMAALLGFLAEAAQPLEGALASAPEAQQAAEPAWPLAAAPAAPAGDARFASVPLPAAPLLAGAPRLPAAVRAPHQDRPDAPSASRFPARVADGSGLARIGVRIGHLSEASAAQLDLDPERVLLIESVEPGSAAERAGLERWDILVQIGGDAATWDRLTEARKRLTHGDDVEVTYLRRGRKANTRLEGAPGSADPARDAYARAHRAHEQARKRHGAQESLRRSLFDAQDSHDAHDLLDKARSFYEGSDPDEVREILEQALQGMHAALESGHAEQSIKTATEALEQVMQGDLNRYLGEVQSYLHSVDPEEFQAQVNKAVQESLKHLEHLPSQSYWGDAGAWHEWADSMRAHKESFPNTNDSFFGRGRQVSPDDSLREELDQARAELESYRAELAELRSELRALRQERQRSGDTRGMR